MVWWMNSNAMTEPFNQSLMQFPGDFSIKIIWKNLASFEADILTLTRQYYPETEDTAIRRQMSQHKKYCSFNITVYATNQATLDALYQELTQHPDAHMVL